MTGGFELLWAVIGLPLAGFLILALAGSSIEKSLGRRALAILSCLPVALAFGLAALLTQKLTGLDAAARSVVVPGLPWIDILGLSIPFEVLADPLSLTMALIITGIGSLIFIYSTGYMAEEKDYSRFFTYLNLFVASMLILVLGNNLGLLFIGWEGVGLCSYLLIGFWYEDLANARAANKAFIVNRVGDWALTLGLFLIVYVLATSRVAAPSSRYLSYDVALPMLYRALASQPGMATAIGLLLFIGACGKSAQFPLYLWLPDAMAGPTPVSALIHAATMVTSGVVLLNRMSIVFQMSPTASAVVCAVGAFTALFAAVIAFGQTDIKKVLAYSTVSQLGFMFIGCGSGAYWTGMFHVTTHAFFKALLFLGAGAVIHAMAHDQDMRNYGNLRKYLPITFITMLIGTLAIAGVPGLSGFYSKEAILGAALGNDHGSLDSLNLSVISGWVGLFVAVLTAAYMMRMFLLTFTGPERWREIPAENHGDDHHHALDENHTPLEVPLSMSIPLVVLAIASLGAGFLLNSGFEKWLYPSGLRFLTEVAHEPEGIPLTMLSMIAAGLGLVIGLVMYGRGLPATEGFDLSKWAEWRSAAANQFGFDSAVTASVVQGGGDLGQLLAGEKSGDAVDQTVNGLTAVTQTLSKGLRSLQNGLVRSYALLMLLGGLFLLGYFALGLGAH